MALKKSQLYSSLWQSCDELRGGMDASQYKDYVLTLLFMKYVSDKYAGKPGALIEIPKGGGFADMVKLKGDKEIGDKINKIIGRLAEANDLKGVIDQADFNDESKLGTGKEMQDRLSKLVAIFDGLDFRANRAEGDDLLGDAYEYLMRHFATESGKSKGQFYTPAEVSRIMAKVIGIGPDTRQDQTIYDPTCGSGSLLLKAADEAPRGITVYGQEMDVATWALARMNMILHGHPTAELWRGNTLASPHFKNKDDSLKSFDFAVANPPFSAKAWSSGLDPANDEFGRFEYGIPPAKNGDYAFLLHLIKSLKSKGKGAIVLPHGVLFRGNKEADIRRTLIQRGLIKGIIGLPANLFYGTGIPACIVVIDKEHAHARTGIFMIDASKGFLKDGNKNRLRAQDIHRIVDVFNRQMERTRYSRMVPVAEIASPANDFNLNIARYIDSSEPEDLHDLDAHLNGGIPNRDIDALSIYWKVFPTLRDALFTGNGREGYSEASIETQQVKPAILGHAEFKAYADRVASIFDAWRRGHESELKGLAVNDLPRTVIHTLSEDLLARFADLPLLSQYDVYQRLMDYWTEVMQDDVYLIAGDGWIVAAKPRGIIEDKDKKIKEVPDLTIKRKKYKMDLVPPDLIVARYFAKERSAIEALQVKQESANRELEEFVEEHSGDEGPLADAVNDKGKVTKGGVKDQLKALDGEPESDEERDALTRCLELIEAEAEAGKAVSAAQGALDEKVLARCTKFTEAEIKTLVVEDKWLASIGAAIEGEIQRLTQRLAERVRELERRYARPLPVLEREVETLSAKVGGAPEDDGAGVGMNANTTRQPPSRAACSSARPRDCRQLEAGLIPHDWRVRSLGSLVRSHNSGIYKRQALYGGGCNIVGVSDIYTIDKVDGQSFASVPLSAQERAKHTLRQGDLLYAESSLVPEGIARTVYVTERGAGTSFAWHTRRYSVHQETVLSSYLYYYLQSRSARAHMLSQSIQTAITGINTAAYFACPVALPSPQEQSVIADALSDADGLLAALEALIAKKRAIKQAVTQQLLTGRTRLPGFDGEWKVTRLGDVATFLKGKGLPKSALTPHGAEPCIHYGELFTRYPETIGEVISRTNRSRDSVRSIANDVLMPTSDVTPRGLAKASCVTVDGVILGGDILVIRSDTGRICGSFLSYVIRREEDQVLQLVTGSTVFHLYGSDMKKFTFLMPSVPEQTAIAAVLTDLEVELAALQQRLVKASAIKQGMMQQLLSGRVRLVKPAPAEASA